MGPWQSSLVHIEGRKYVCNKILFSFYVCNRSSGDEFKKITTRDLAVPSLKDKEK